MLQAPAHRIDKPVSGVFILGRSTRGSWKLGAAMSAEGSGKRYLARVRGRFPGQIGETVTVDSALRMTRLRGLNGRLAQCACTESSPSEHSAALQTGSPNQISNKGLGDAESSTCDADADRTGPLKPARTTFCLLGYDEASDTSLVQAELHSGRRHQIRAHLAVLRHPIANDELYCPGGIGWDSCRPERLSKAGDPLHHSHGDEDANRSSDQSQGASGHSYPTGNRIAFVDDDDHGYPLRKMFTDARVAWCPSCDWALAQLDVAAAATGAFPELTVAPTSRAKLSVDTESDKRDGGCSATSVGAAGCQGAGRTVTMAGGRIWLHALEYRFTMDGHSYRFQSALPEFVWGVEVPDYDGICSCSKIPDSESA